MQRNGMLPFGAWIEQAAAQCVGDGFRLEPDTGDAGLNRDIKALWHDWANDAARCDISGQLAFWQIENLLDIAELSDGDTFVNPLTTGHLQILEADRCLSPYGATITSKLGGGKPVTHCGVRKDPHGRPIEYWFARSTPTHAGSVSIDKMDRIAAYRDGEPNLFHIYDPRRVNQTRGIPVLAAAMIAAGMAEDLTFAQLVKNQVASCVALFITREHSAMDFGPQENDRLDGTNTETLEAMTPGLIVRGQNGEKLEGFSPNIPGADWAPYWKQLVRILAIHLGLPLEQAMWDMSDTNFSGHRMAVQEAHKRTRRRQKNRIARFHQPVYRWKLRQLIPILGIDTSVSAKLQRIRENGTLFRHKWILPRREYIDPSKDAQADVTRMRNGLDSPRDIVAERGIEWAEVVTETVEDRAFAIETALERAANINQRYPDAGITWRDVLSWDAPKTPNASASGPVEQETPA
jgi:lambda family phage portal protein